MAKKQTPPPGIIKEKQPEKTLRIEGMVGYRLILTKKDYNASYDSTTENDLMYLIGAENVLYNMEEAVKSNNVYTVPAKKKKRDKLESLRKLKLEMSKCITELIDYLVESKDQAHYDEISDKIHGRSKPSIIPATIEEAKKVTLLKP